MASIVSIVITICIVFFFFSWFIRVINADERMAIYTLGKFDRFCGPGIVLLIPVIQIGKRIKILDSMVVIPDLEASKGQTTLRLDMILNPKKTSLEHPDLTITDPGDPFRTRTENVLRMVIEKLSEDELKTEPETLSRKMAEMWDFEATTVEFRNIRIEHPIEQLITL